MKTTAVWCRRIPRRQFLKTAASALPAAWLPPDVLAAAVDGSAPALPPIRQITTGPRFHWFGYYDKFQFDPTNRFVLSNEVDFEGRSPTPDDIIRVGVIDLQDKDRWTELGKTRAWNWQQGCMLQWVPGTASTVMWNDREDGRFVCRMVDIRAGTRRTIPHALYNLSPDGRWGIAPDFPRLNDCRPGYGYAGIPDPNRDVLAPHDSGIWKIDLHSGEATLVFTLADAARLPYPAGFSANAKHWFNHLLFSPDAARFIFLHRWRGDGQAGFNTRLFTMAANGTDPYILDPLGKTSHFIWRDPTHVAAWAFHPSRGERFYVFEDKTDRVEAIGPNVMIVNGHNTYVPGTNDKWILNDTYPDSGSRLQHPYVYHVPTGRRIPLGHFPSPQAYQGEWRCDTHPRASRDGRLVCIDSAHTGGRQLYLIEISDIVRHEP